MPKYKALVKNPIEIGKFKSEKGILNVVNPTKEEQLKIDRAVETGMLEKISSPTESVKTATAK